MPPIRTYLAYCSARDQNVRVVRKSKLTGTGEPDGPAATPDASDVLCLDYGERCTGSTCPLFDVPTDAVRRRLVEAGVL